MKLARRNSFCRDFATSIGTPTPRSTHSHTLKTRRLNEPRFPQSRIFKNCLARRKKFCCGFVILGALTGGSPLAGNIYVVPSSFRGPSQTLPSEAHAKRASLDICAHLRKRALSIIAASAHSA
ncbi:hypothetical protein D9611_005363 [Ephemerocybe angulata]|uniref:Uncharacterized protein n=1 Tax=Ephemerocybe angulata TaxID=980116 RepID=A0A8H5C291_9AGAR|nr:hypothetical protein D9611_005363 [Tulosesus angulatus]